MLQTTTNCCKWSKICLGSGFVGYPKGTVLGHLLFSLYISGISSDIESEIRRFDDDGVCYREIKDEEDTTCNLQYVGQICRALQKRFSEHYRRMKKPKPIDTFLYRHFKLSGHSHHDGLVQPVEKLTYDKNSSLRFKIIKRHESELKRMKIITNTLSTEI